MKTLSTECHFVFVKLLNIMDLLNQKIMQVITPEENVSNKSITNLEINYD